MTDDRSPADIVDSVLRALVTTTRARDVAACLDLFTADASLFGSEADEEVHGRPALEQFLTVALAQPFTLGWRWERPTAARRDGIVWFVAPATFEPIGDGSPGELPYRLSGVLAQQADGAWRFELFNGTEPRL